MQMEISVFLSEIAKFSLLIHKSSHKIITRFVFTWEIKIPIFTPLLIFLAFHILISTKYTAVCNRAVRLHYFLLQTLFAAHH